MSTFAVKDPTLNEHRGSLRPRIQGIDPGCGFRRLISPNPAKLAQQFRNGSRLRIQAANLPKSGNYSSSSLGTGPCHKPPSNPAKKGLTTGDTVRKFPPAPTVGPPTADPKPDDRDIGPGNNI